MKGARRLFMEQDHGDELEFRWRGGDVSRIEGISDAMLAFAMTLVVVSLKVPEKWSELELVLIQLPAFFACFLLIGWIWVIHYYFFRRFGLEDGITITLNGFLLFSVLAYVFPLKYLFTALIGQMTGVGDPEYWRAYWPPDEAGREKMMLFYNVGFTAIFLWFTLMYWHAWRQRDAFDLNPPERSICRGALRANAAMVLLGLLSIGMIFVHTGYSGMVFFAIGPIQGILGWRNGVRVSREFKEWKAARVE